MTEPVLPPLIGRYRPTGVLGAGAMGTVYRAHDPAIDRTVAIKVVRTDGVDEATKREFLDRFRLEVQAAGRCTHPGIVGVYDFSGDVDDPFIVMEFVEGRTLQQLLRAADRPSLSRCIGMVAEVLAALGYAHGLLITHRDIKPANIIVTPAGQAKIADFGIARLNRASVTEVGAMVGTPSYMAPEQVTGQKVDHRTDLFAVGAMLGEILLGRPPFAGGSLSETIYRLTSPDPANLDGLHAAGLSRFEPVLRQALAKEPAGRFQSAAQFAAAIVAALTTTDPGIDGTVVMLRNAGVPPAMADATSPSMAGTVFGPSGMHWTREMLREIEQQLVRFVGPMARITVRQMAAQAATPEALYQALAQTLPRADDRLAFLRSVPWRAAEPTMLRAAPPAALQVTGGTAPAFRPEALQNAQTALAQYVGPIAKILGAQSAKAAASPRDFCERLLAHVKKPDDAQALRRKLLAEVEPRLLS